MSETLSQEKCPVCIDEQLIRTVGNLAVCPNCDLILLVKDEIKPDYLPLPPTA